MSLKKFEESMSETISRLKYPGVLLIGSKREGSGNVMTIGWGLMGVFWGTPMYMVAVRHSRYTHEFIEDTSEFTVNVPGEEMNKVVAFCGKVSGRTHDKLKKHNLSLVKGKKVKVPVIKECKIHYECKVMHKLEIKPKLVPDNVKKRYYPKGDYHTLYFGKILAVY